MVALDSAFFRSRKAGLRVAHVKSVKFIAILNPAFRDQAMGNIESDTRLDPTSHKPTRTLLFRPRMAGRLGGRAAPRTVV